MLFEERFVEGIEAGRVTLTFRRWKRPGAKAGSTHRIFGRALIEIDSVTMIDESEITTGEAQAAGFDSLDELWSYMDPRPATPATDRLYRVVFHYTGPVKERIVETQDLPAIVEMLAKMDRASKHGPWTVSALRAIEERPRTLAARLAGSLGRDTAPFKADVRKLKYLGLTRSLEVGYELTEAGEQVLAMLEVERAAPKRPRPALFRPEMSDAEIEAALDRLYADPPDPR